MRKTVVALRTGLVCLLLALWCSSATAAGFKLLEQSAEGVGNAFAGATAGYGDGSEVFFNPAAMTAIDDTKVSASVHFIFPQAEFTNQGSTINPALGGTPLMGSNGPDGGESAVVPNFYVVQPVDDFRFGFGLNAPFGLATEYDREYVGRYHGVKSELQVIQLTPAVAYQVHENFSIGAAFRAVYADAELTNAIDFGTIGVATLGPATAAPLGLLPQMADGFGKVEGDDWGAGFSLSAAVHYGEDNRNRIGLTWQTKVDLTLSGPGTFEVPTAALPLTATGFFTDTSGRAELNLPESIAVGARHYVTDDLILLADIEWTAWDRFEQLVVSFDNGQPDSVTDEGWQPVWRYSAGAQYYPIDDLLLQFGLAYDESPVPDAQHRTPRIPDNDRFWLSFGARYAVTEAVRVGASYTHIFVDEANSMFADSTGNVLIGEWETGVDIASLDVVVDL